jgi:hypothetical protein
MAEVILVSLLIVVGIVALLVTLLALFGNAMGRVTNPYGAVTIVCLGGAAAFIFT